MFLSNILTEFKNFIETVGILDDYQVQITPDDRPFASSGSKTITIYGKEIFRRSTKQAADYQVLIEMSINRKCGQFPYDRSKVLTYLEEISALSTVSSILTTLIDNNNILYSNIVSSISSSKNSVIASINSLENLPDRPLTDAENSLLFSIENAQVLTPILAMGYSASPIPRFDQFFTAFNTKKAVEQVVESDRIQESGWSMKVAFQGPIILLRTPC